MFKQMIVGKYQPHSTRFPTCCHPLISGYPAQYIMQEGKDGFLTAQLPDSGNKLGSIFPVIDCHEGITDGLGSLASAIMYERGNKKSYASGIVIHGLITGNEMALQGVLDDYVGDFGDVEGLHFMGLYCTPYTVAKEHKDSIDLGMRRADLMRGMMSEGWTNGTRNGPIWMMPLYTADDEMQFLQQCDKWRNNEHPIYCTYSRQRFPDFGVYGGVAWDQTVAFHQQIYAKPSNDQIDYGIL